MQQQRGIAVMAQAILVLLRNICGASAVTMMGTQLRNDNACIAGVAPTTATLWQCNHSCGAGAANNGNAMATQQGRLRCQCYKDNSKAMTTQ
jgi:hypothetical protein